MPAIDGPPSPLALSRHEDESAPTRRTSRKTSHSYADEDAGPAPMSPRVRKRLDEAKENANVFGPVCEQGEVVQWMTACHTELIAFGRDLERRGFTTLSSIAFLTDEDIDPSIEQHIRQHLLSTLSTFMRLTLVSVGYISATPARLVT